MFLLDSLLPSPELPDSLHIQLAQIYGSSDDQLLVEVLHLSKQDMGLYAIANMLEFCEGGFAKFKTFDELVAGVGDIPWKKIFNFDKTDFTDDSG